MYFIINIRVESTPFCVNILPGRLVFIVPWFRRMMAGVIYDFRESRRLWDGRLGRAVSDTCKYSGKHRQTDNSS